MRMLITSALLVTYNVSCSDPPRCFLTECYQIKYRDGIAIGQPDGGVGMNNIGAVDTTIKNCGTSGRADYTAHYIRRGAVSMYLSLNSIQNIF